MNIGEIIAQGRRAKNLTQKEFAKLFFVSAQAVGKWERGESLPDILTLMKISDFLGSNCVIGSATYIKKTLKEGAMKNIIIWGPTRSGRSWLSRMIKHEFGHNLVTLDQTENSKMTTAMAAQLIKEQCRHGEFYVIDADATLDIEKVFASLETEDFQVIGIGFAEISPEQESKMDEGKHTMEFIKARIAESKHIKTVAAKRGWQYFDVSFDREQKLKDIVAVLKK